MHHRIERLLFGMWYVGKLDAYLPDAVHSKRVLGDLAPGAKPVDEPPAKPAAPAPSAAPAPPAPSPPAK